MSAIDRSAAAKLAVENAKRRKAEALAKQQQQQAAAAAAAHRAPLSSSAPPSSFAADDDDGNNDEYGEPLESLADDEFAESTTAAAASTTSAPLPSASRAPLKSTTQYGQISQIMRPGASVAAAAAPARPLSPLNGSTTTTSSSPPAARRGVSLAVLGTKASRAAAADAGNGSGAPISVLAAPLVQERAGSLKRVNRERGVVVPPLPTFAAAAAPAAAGAGPRSANVNAVISPRHNAPSSPPSHRLQTQSLGDAETSPRSPLGSMRVGYSGVDAPSPYSGEPSEQQADELSREAVAAYGRDPQHTDSLTAHDLRGFVWYFGAMSADDAFNMLRKHDIGYFLVRLSSRPKCFTISWVRAAKTIVHTVVSPGSDGWLMDGEPGKVYKSVFDVVQRHKKIFQTPLRGPFIAAESKN